MNPQKAQRWIYKDTYVQLLKHGMITKWSEVPADEEGVLRFKNITFFNEGFFIVPFLLQFVMFKCEETRDKFLAKMHEGEAVMKI